MKSDILSDMEQLKKDIVQNIQTYYDNLVALIPKLIVAVLFFLLAWWIANVITNALKKRLGQFLDDPLLVLFIARAVKIVLFTITLLIVLQILGLGVAAAGLLGTAGVGAFVIGFAFKDIGEHLLAGVLLAFNRPFKIGDIVELGGEVGVVVTLNLRNTHIKTFDGKDVYIPNGNIVKQPLVNYTIDGFLRNDFDIEIARHADVSKAIQLILHVLAGIEGVLHTDKKPMVHIVEIDPQFIRLKVYYWFNTFDKNVSSLALKTQAIEEVAQQLQQEGYKLPHQVVEIKKIEE